MKKEKLKIGHIGESIASKYLRKKGYRIIERNYKTKYAEIDLVVHRGSILVFVEVRTRTGKRFGSPEESIKKDKLYRLVKNAQAYMNRIRYYKEFRIDAICIILDENSCLMRISHYENITF